MLIKKKIKILMVLIIFCTIIFGFNITCEAAINGYDTTGKLAYAAKQYPEKFLKWKYSDFTGSAMIKEGSYNGHEGVQYSTDICTYHTISSKANEDKWIIDGNYNNPTITINGTNTITGSTKSQKKSIIKMAYAMYKARITNTNNIYYSTKSLIKNLFYHNQFKKLIWSHIDSNFKVSYTSAVSDDWAIDSSDKQDVNNHANYTELKKVTTSNIKIRTKTASNNKTYKVIGPFKVSYNLYEDCNTFNLTYTYDGTTQNSTLGIDSVLQYNSDNELVKRKSGNITSG